MRTWICLIEDIMRADLDSFAKIRVHVLNRGSHLQLRIPPTFCSCSEKIALALTAATDFTDYTDFMDDSIPERQQPV